jgi:hypothetical protein
MQNCITWAADTELLAHGSLECHVPHEGDTIYGNSMGDSWVPLKVIVARATTLTSRAAEPTVPRCKENLR